MRQDKEPFRVLKKLNARAKQLKTDIPALFLCLKGNDTPLAAKILAGLTVGYALSPIDLIPDFIPVIGYPKDTFDRYRKEAELMWENGKPKKWRYAIPIVAIWLLILWLIIKAIFF